jgi:hypothetical protein
MSFILKKMVMGRFKTTIKSLIKEGRLVFLNAEQVRYTDKKGKITTLSLDAFVDLALEQSGLTKDVMNGGSPLTYLGLGR